MSAYKRVSLSLYKDEYEVLKHLADLRGRPLANMVKELAMQIAKEEEEDLWLAEQMEGNDYKSMKKVSHEEVWKKLDI